MWRDPFKSRKNETPIFGFSDDDYVGVSLLHTDSLVITLTIVNHNIHWILVDNRSSDDILYWLAFYVYGYKSGEDHSGPISSHGVCRRASSTIELPVTA